MTIRRWSLLLIGLLIIAGVVVWTLAMRSSSSRPDPATMAPGGQMALNQDTGSTQTKPATPVASLPPAETAAATPIPSLAPPPPQELAGADVQPPRRPEPAPNRNPPAPLAEDPREDLDQLSLAFRDYRTVLGENPVGTNDEITAALFGVNKKQFRSTMPLGSQLNGKGELCDRWGTPYFFHQMSKLEMEVRSAGPDRKMWTDDDRVGR